MTNVSNRLSRRQFGLAAGSAAMLGALGAPAIVRAQGTKTKIRLTQPTDSLSYMPISVARALGYFEDAGLDVELIITKGDGPDVQALMAKEVEFVVTPPSHLYTLYLQRQYLLGVCGILGRCGINLVIGREAAKTRGITESSTIDEKLAALKGLTIGCSAPGSLTFNIAQYYILRAGLVPQKDAKVVPAGTGAAAIAAMKHGVTDAYSFSSPLTDQLVEEGIADWLINNARGEDPKLDPFLHAVIYVRPDYAEKNSDLVKTTLAAVVKAQTWIHANPATEVAKTLRKYYSKIDEKVYESAVANVREAVVSDGKMTVAGSDAYEQVMLDTGSLKEHVPFDKVFTNKYLPTGA